MDNFLIYEEIHKRDACVVYRGRIKQSIDFVMIYCVEKHKRHELSNLVRLMYELDHPHVMKFREWYETTNHLWLVMDLCDGGSLKSIIQADGALPETSIRIIGVNICQGLYYLHQQDIIFCDLSPDKIVSDGSNIFKLGNMTLSRMKGEHLQTIFDETYDNYLDDVYRGKERPKAQAENFFYTAPEVLRGGEHTISSDLWSVGCILYEMIAGRQLYDEKNTNKLTQKILNDRLVLPTTKGSTKLSIEFTSLLQGLLVKESSKRLDWPAVLTHPFWAGQLTHLVRPQTGVTKKSVNKSDALDRSAISSRLAPTDRPESNVSFSLSCTKTSIQLTQPHKTVEVDGNKTLTNDRSSINTHEQSTAIGSESIERIRKMLFSKAELQPTSIVENQKIQKTLPFKFENKLLPFQLGKYENLSRLSSVDLQEHANMIKKELSITSAGSPTNANGMRVKLNLLNYIGSTCLEQTNSGAFADVLIIKDVHKDLLNLITNGGSMEL
ncbi:unnamed protein product [Adineta steineri]|uniref:Protein kinase domain-containing protein n=2 Tax=Adineta steineri TaxID=433720 RepID=A0A815EKZ7_9BILA|nr:unnamed protein product [Adineta steineri]CAF1581317.1 unnamed protein product [Adineta steineri]